MYPEFSDFFFFFLVSSAGNCNDVLCIFTWQVFLVKIILHLSHGYVSVFLEGVVEDGCSQTYFSSLLLNSAFDLSSVTTKI